MKTSMSCVTATYVMDCWIGLDIKKRNSNEKGHGYFSFKASQLGFHGRTCERLTCLHSGSEMESDH